MPSLTVETLHVLALNYLCSEFKTKDSQMDRVRAPLLKETENKTVSCGVYTLVILHYVGVLVSIVILWLRSILLSVVFLKH